MKIAEFNLSVNFLLIFKSVSVNSTEINDKKIFSKVFVYKIEILILMLTSNLKQVIDQKWDNCWPLSNLRPVALLDLTAYIYFLKKSEDLDLISKNLSPLKSRHFTFSKEIEEFSWSEFRDMEAAAIHDLFTRQFGILDLMSEYAQSDFLYSPFFRTPLMLKPTSKLLINVIEIVNLIESSDTATQSAIIEYLFSKAQTIQESQFIPTAIYSLMVSIAEPCADDIICDISTGNGSLLVNAAAYIENDHAPLQHLSSTLKGLQSHPSLLRIAGMRMMLHGINEPDVETLPSTDVALTQKPTLFISNLLPAGNADNMFAEDASSENVQPEIILLNDILKNLHAGSRAIVLVSENLLKSFLPEFENIRKEIVDNTNLEGVIHLFPHGKSYSAAGILIFSKHGFETTSEVWFCKMGKRTKRRTVNETITNPDQNEILLSEEMTEVNVVLDQWKKRKEISGSNCFFINAYDIKANNYNLNFNDYKLISSEEQIDDTVEKDDQFQTHGKAIVATKKDSLHRFYSGPAPLKKQKRRRKAVPALLLIFILIITAGWTYLYYLKDNKKSNRSDLTVADSVNTISKMPVRDSTIKSSTKRASVKKNNATKTTVHPVKKAEPEDHSSKRYTVLNKTWFHSAPDSGKRKSFYLEPRQDLVLVPTQEENGFVYVVYINKKGESTHGWLAKKDLEPVD